MAGIVVAVLGVLVSAALFYAYQQRAPMRDPARVAQLDANVEAVVTPTIKKGQDSTELRHQVRYAYVVDGATYHGSYVLRGVAALPAVGDTVVLVYLRSRPRMALRAEEYAQLAHGLAGLKAMALASLLIGGGLGFWLMRGQ